MGMVKDSTHGSIVAKWLHKTVLVILMAFSLWWLYGALTDKVFTDVLTSLEKGSRLTLLVIITALALGTAMLLSERCRAVAMKMFRFIRSRKWFIFGLMVFCQLMIWLSFGAVSMGADQESIRIATEDPQKYSDYLSYCPNNVFIAYIYWTVRNLIPGNWPANSATLAMQFLNIIVLDSCFIGLWGSLKRFSTGLADTALLLFMFLFGFSGYTILVYTDILSLPFSVGALAIGLTMLHETGEKTVLKGPHLKAMGLMFLLGVLIYLGYQMKASSVIPTFCLLIVLGYRSISLKMYRHGAICVVACIVGMAITVPIFSLAIHNHMKLNYNPNESYPVSHFMVMGMQDRGGFSLEERLAVSKYPTKAEKSRYSAEQIKKRLSDYGPVGYAEFLARKANYTFSDGTFSFGNWDSMFNYLESNQTGVLSRYQKTILARGIRALYTPTGIRYVNVYLFEQCFFILMVVGVISLIVRNIHEPLQGSDGNLIRFWLLFSILGAVAFLMLFESGRSKYLIQFLPVMICAASYGLITLRDRCTRIYAE